MASLTNYLENWTSNSVINLSIIFAMTHVQQTTQTRVTLVNKFAYVAPPSLLNGINDLLDYWFDNEMQTQGIFFT
jgi:hypothetical protein